MKPIVTPLRLDVSHHVGKEKAKWESDMRQLEYLQCYFNASKMDTSCAGDDKKIEDIQDLEEISRRGKTQKRESRKRNFQIQLHGFGSESTISSVSKVGIPESAVTNSDKRGRSRDFSTTRWVKRGCGCVYQSSVQRHISRLLVHPKGRLGRVGSLGCLLP
jgi:hypothetical protein